MDYNILEARVEFENNQLRRVTVLVEISAGDVRAIFADSVPRPQGGYMWLEPGTVVSDKLLQEVAGYGSAITGLGRDAAFPDWQKRHLRR